MEVQSEISVDRPVSVLRVPNSAIVERQGRTFCVVYDSGRMIDRDVALGYRGDEFTEIRRGLVEGEQVVANPGLLASE